MSDNWQDTKQLFKQKIFNELNEVTEALKLDDLVNVHRHIKLLNALTNKAYKIGRKDLSIWHNNCRIFSIQKIKSFLNDGKAYSYMDLEQNIDLSRATLSKYLKILVATGEVKRLSKSRKKVLYQLNGVH